MAKIDAPVISESLTRLLQDHVEPRLDLIHLGVATVKVIVESGLWLWDILIAGLRSLPHDHSLQLIEYLSNLTRVQASIDIRYEQCAQSL